MAFLEVLSVVSLVVEIISNEVEDIFVRVLKRNKTQGADPGEIKDFLRKRENVLSTVERNDLMDF